MDQAFLLKTKKKPEKKKPARPKGSRNQIRDSSELSPRLLWIPALRRHLLWLTGTQLNLRYFVYDNAWGNNEGAAMVKPLGLDLISKLRCDAALWFPDEGPYQGRGAPRKYGKKVDYPKIPDRYLKNSEVTTGVLTDIDQMTVWHNRFAPRLNVVVIRKTNRKTEKVA